MNSVFNPAAFIAVVQLHLLRRPLLHAATACDLLDRNPLQLRELIQAGRLPFAWDIAARPKVRSELRVYSLSVAELLGYKCPVGATRDFGLPEVINSFLPERDVRGAELQRMLAASSDTIGELKRAGVLVVARRAAAKQGVNSSHIFKRQSIAAFLTERRVA